jgi:curved DNA-binding protein CbpA
MAKNERQKGILKYINKVFPALPTLSYYQILGLQRTAPHPDVRKAYYRIAGNIHPDLHGKSLSESDGQKMTAVFSRAAEAYQVLSDPKSRRQYDEGLKEGNKRFDAGAAKIKKVVRPEDAIRNPHAKRFYLLAMESLAKKNKSSALLNLKMALSAEPSSPVIKAAIAEAEKP